MPKPKQPPWEIRVGRKDKILAEFCVPAHKMQKNDLESFLRAVVVRYQTDGPEDMVVHYVNRRLGPPSRSSFAEVKYGQWLDECRVGYWCGDWECYAYAKHKIDVSVSKWLKKQLQRSKTNS